MPAILFDNFIDYLDQHLWFTRLYYKSTGTNLHGQFFVLWPSVGCSIKYQWNGNSFFVALNLATQLKTIHNRHENITDNQVNLALSHKFQRFGTIRASHNLMPISAQQNL